MCFLSEECNCLGHRGDKEAVVRGVVTPLVIYTSPRDLHSLFFSVGKALLAAWLYVQLGGEAEL